MVFGESRLDYYFGLICGQNNGIIEECSAYENILLSGNVSHIHYTYNQWGYSSHTVFYFGGLAGQNYSIVRNCFVCSNIIDNVVTTTKDFNDNPRIGNEDFYHRVYGVFGFSGESTTNIHYFGEMDAIASDSKAKIIQDEQDSILTGTKIIKYVIGDKIIYQQFESHEAKKALQINFDMDGYQLIGWSLEKNGELFYTLDDYVQIPGNTNSLILYAVLLKEEINLTFDANGGTGTMNSKIVYADTEITLPSCTFVAPDGYHFAGWSDTQDGEIKYLDGANYTSNGINATLYAIWEPNENKIIFNANGGMGTMENQIISTGNEEKLYLCTLEAPDGYYFAGWSTSPDGEVEYYDGDNFAMGAKSIYYLYAIWRPIE